MNTSCPDYNLPVSTDPLRYKYPCCRCGFCCLSCTCARGQEVYGVGKPDPCPGLSFDADGLSICQLAETTPGEAEFFGTGCCIKARAFRNGLAYDFSSLPEALKHLAVYQLRLQLRLKKIARKPMTNEEYAQRAEMALAAYPNREDEDLSASIVDLVTDLLHLAHQNDIEPDYVTSMAQTHYGTEITP